MTNHFLDTLTSEHERVCACTRVCVRVHYLSSKCRNTDITVQLALLVCESPWLSLMDTQIHSDSPQIPVREWGGI